MQNNFSDLNGFPTDNSPSTNLKYDIVASKFMTGINNHNKRNAPVYQSNDLVLFDAVMQIIVAVLVIVGAVLQWSWKSLNK